MGRPLWPPRQTPVAPPDGVEARQDERVALETCTSTVDEQILTDELPAMCTAVKLVPRRGAGACQLRFRGRGARGRRTCKARGLAADELPQEIGVSSSVGRPQGQPVLRLPAEEEEVHQQTQIARLRAKRWARRPLASARTRTRSIPAGRQRRRPGRRVRQGRMPQSHALTHCVAAAGGRSSRQRET